MNPTDTDARELARTRVDLLDALERFMDVHYEDKHTDGQICLMARSRKSGKMVVVHAFRAGDVMDTPRFERFMSDTAQRYRDMISAGRRAFWHEKFRA